MPAQSKCGKRDEGDQAFKAGKYARAYAQWFPGAEMGDSKQISMPITHRPSAPSLEVTCYYQMTI